MINTIITHQGDMETKTINFEIDGQKRTSISTYRTGHEHETPNHHKVIDDKGKILGGYLDENGLNVRYEEINGTKRITYISNSGDILYKELKDHPGVIDIENVNINLKTVKALENLPEELKIPCRKVINKIIKYAQQALK